MYSKASKQALTSAYAQRLKITYSGRISCTSKYKHATLLAHVCANAHAFAALAADMLSGAGCPSCATPMSPRARHLTPMLYDRRVYMLGTNLDRKALPLLLSAVRSKQILTKFEYPVPPLVARVVPGFYIRSRNMLVETFDAADFDSAKQLIHQNYCAANANTFAYGAAFIGDKDAVLLTTADWLFDRGPDNDLAWALKREHEPEWWGIGNYHIGLHAFGYTKDDWFALSPRTRKSIQDAADRDVADALKKQNDAFGTWCVPAK